MNRTLLAALFVAAALCVPPSAQAASASSSGTCTSKQVTVVVQFPDHTATGCASGNPSSGYAALKDAGFVVTYVADSGGALCTINEFPVHPCGNTMPPASAYWAYFHAKPGGSWSYSDTGGGSYDPAPGSVEGWRFGSGTAPTGSAPSLAVPVKTPTKAPTKAPSKEPTKGSTKAPTTSPTKSSTKSAASAASSTSTASSTSSTAATPSATPAPGSSSTPATTPSATASSGIPDRAAGMNEKSVPTSSSSNGGFSWIWGVVLLVVLVAAGGATALARRRG